MAVRIVATDADVAEGAAWLCAAEPRFAHALAATGPWPLRRRPAGCPALLHAIVGQQVSTASASAIWGRVAAAGLDDPARITAATEDDLRACGLSRPKARYFRALADADLDYDALHRAGDEDLVAALVAVPGIGRWTAEIYALFALGRADVFAPGDLALQEGARLLFDLPARPTERALRDMALPWSPWRGVAARALWAYYAHARGSSGDRAAGMWG
jgi:DNA-3-methyladenine glycosylase II